MVTLLLPTATPSSNSKSFSNPSVCSNHFALFPGFRTARPKCPTTPTVNGIFLASRLADGSPSPDRFFFLVMDDPILKRSLLVRQERPPAERTCSPAETSALLPSEAPAPKA